MTERDEIRNQMVWSRLIAAIEEQAQTVIRTAFSQSVRECGDLSAGVFNRRGRMVAQAVTGTPGHVNSMAICIEHFLDAFPIDTMRPGDVFVTNDPWLSVGHYHDVTVVDAGLPSRPCGRPSRKHLPYRRHGREGIRTRRPTVLRRGDQHPDHAPGARGRGQRGPHGASCARTSATRPTWRATSTP